MCLSLSLNTFLQKFVVIVNFFLSLNFVLVKIESDEASYVSYENRNFILVTKGLLRLVKNHFLIIRYVSCHFLQKMGKIQQISESHQNSWILAFRNSRKIKRNKSLFTTDTHYLPRRSSFESLQTIFKFDVTPFFFK